MNNTNFNGTSNFTGSTRRKYDLSALNTALAVSEAVLIPVIIIGNLLLIFSILNNRTLRQDFRHLAIVSIATADLLAGLITCPVIADMKANNHRRQHGCATYLIISTLDFYVQKFVVTWGIISINADYLLTLHRVKMRLSPLIRKCAIGICLALPWLAMLFVVLPIAYTHVGSVSLSYICILRMSPAATLLVTCFASVVPSLIAVLQIIHMIILHCCNSRRQIHPVTTDAGSNKSPWIFVCATVATILLILPEEAARLIRMKLIHQLDIHVYVAIVYSIVALADAKSAVLPFIWFMEADMRAAVQELYNRLPWRSSFHRCRARGDFVVDYKNF
ncbi:uncharacterized protein LOC124131353 [Haliotis rufescens]|uniref:uncharacterized protein LOC124131353 n=1 Tax=Haliotis rufescens TaxID=6454 RepID=UPI001EB09126|nr:uncharacterized protein LOC124131353 [Haliotis rufescens]